MTLGRTIMGALAALWLTGCATTGGASLPELPRADSVDLERFMGDWYVIAHIPTFPERRAFNAVERYELAEDGTVPTTFRFRQGAFDGRERVLTPMGFPDADPDEAVWGMQFIRPFKAEYVIAWVDDEYQGTIIARSKRDYVWFMHREPSVSLEVLDAALARITEMGYDVNEVRLVPQRWPEPPPG